MSKIYTYPHVRVNTNAQLHKTVSIAREDTTALFVPFVSKRGAANEIKRIFTLGEFISEYGDLDYKTQGQTALNIANWLTYGGTVYAYRMVADNAATAAGEDSGEIVKITAKHQGDFYNGITVTLKRIDNLNFSVTLKNGNQNLIEQISKISKEKLELLGETSEYIGSLEITGTLPETGDIVVTLTGGADGSFGTEAGRTQLDIATEALFTNQNVEGSLLSNSLENPFQIILDAGFSDKTKKALYGFITSENVGRYKDVLLVLDDKVADVSEAGFYTGKAPNASTVYDGDAEDGPAVDYRKEGCIAVYTQSFLINEASYAGKDIYVTATYFLSNLIPYNDDIYGVQFPTAGLTRGKISGVKGLSDNPTPNDKQAYFSRRHNYVEKDSRGYYFMSQRTYDCPESEGTFSALSFVNNVRVKNKIVQDLRRIGREYLFEFNDATTISNMSNALNRYVEGWVQNRVLSYANVLVAANAYSNEMVDVVLSIKFAGTIEIINIDINIE